MSNCEARSNGIWEREFEHASRLVLAARRERAHGVAVYLLLVGGAGTLTAVAPPFGLGRTPDVAAAPHPVLFLALALVGVFTLVRLMRTRHAESDGLRVMALLRNHAAQRDPELVDLQRSVAEPRIIPGRAWSVAFDQATLVMLLDSASFGIAAQAAGFRVPLGDYAVGAFAAVVFLAWQVLYYVYQLPVEA